MSRIGKAFVWAVGAFSYGVGRVAVTGAELAFGAIASISLLDGRYLVAAIALAGVGCYCLRNYATAKTYNDK